MAGLQVLQMVPATDTGFLDKLGQQIGQIRTDSQINDIMRGLDPSNPDSLRAVTSKLYSQGPQGRELADRLLGAYERREEKVYQRGETVAQRKRVESASKAIAGALGQPQITDQPDTEVPPPAQADTGKPITPETPAPVFADAAPKPPPTTQAPAPAARPPSTGRPSPAPASNLGAMPGTPGTQLPAVAPPTGYGPAPSFTGATPGAPSVAPPQPAPGVTPRPIPRRGAGLAEMAPMGAGAGGGRPPPALAPTADQVLPSQAASIPTGPNPPPGPVDFRPLVGREPAPIARPGPTQSILKAQAENRQLEALKNNPYLDANGKAAITSRIKYNDDLVKTINERLNKEYELRLKTRGDYNAKDVEHAQRYNDKVVEQMSKDANSAFSLTRANKILDEGLRTGQLSPKILGVAKTISTIADFGELFGINRNRFEIFKKADNIAGAMEEFRGLASKALFDILGGFGSQVSNSDRETIEQVTASLPKGIEGNRRLLKFAADLTQTRLEAGKEVQQYMQYRRERGETISSSDMARIQHEHLKRAIVRLENEVTPYGYERKEPGAAGDKTPSARGGRSAAPEVPAGAPAIGTVIDGRPYKGGPLDSKDSWGPKVQPKAPPGGA